MTIEQATFVLGVLVLAVQFFQAYITLGLKLWTTQKFVAKDDMDGYLGPMKENIQRLHSDERNRHA